MRSEEGALQQIKDITGARYFCADNAAEMASICRSLNARIAVERRSMELVAMLCLAATLMACDSVLLPLLRETALCNWMNGKLVAQSSAG
jgi:hypothetical protein